MGRAKVDIRIPPNLSWVTAILWPYVEKEEAQVNLRTSPDAPWILAIMVDGVGLNMCLFMYVFIWGVNLAYTNLSEKNTKTHM